MPQKELSTDEIIEVAEKLTKVIKQKESEKSELTGRKDSLYERLEKELGFSTLAKARKALKDKEELLTNKEGELHTKFTTLKEREEWKISIQQSTSS